MDPRPACITCAHRHAAPTEPPCDSCLGSNDASSRLPNWEPITPFDSKPGPIVPLNPTPEIRVQATVVGLGPGRDGLVQVELGFSRTDQIDFCVQASRDVAAAFLPGDAVTLTITPGATT